MRRRELTLLLEGRLLTLEDAVALGRLGRLYRFGVPPLDPSEVVDPASGRSVRNGLIKQIVT